MKNVDFLNVDLDKFVFYKTINKKLVFIIDFFNLFFINILHVADLFFIINNL